MMISDFHFHENDRFVRKMHIAEWAKAENMEQSVSQLELWSYEKLSGRLKKALMRKGD